MYYTIDELNKILEYQNLDTGFQIVNPKDIDMEDAVGIEEEDFWNHHGNCKDDYNDLIDDLIGIYDELINGKKINDIMARFSEHPLRDAAYVFFSRSEAIKVERTGYGKLCYRTDGRHRIMIAKERSVPIPVIIIN